MVNKNEKVGIVTALLKFLDTNEIEGKITFGSIGLSLVVIAVGFAINLPAIMQAIKCN